MSEGHGRTSFLGRRGFLTGGIALSTFTSITSTFREASGKTCMQHQGTGGNIKLDQITDRDWGTVTAGNASVGELANLIFIANNADYVETTGSGASMQKAIYVLKGQDITMHIQGDGSNPACTFLGATKNLVKAMRIPYFGTNNRGNRCVPEHILIGYETLGITIPAGASKPWATASSARPLDEWGDAIVTFLATRGGAPSVAPDGWQQIVHDSAPSDWRFRGQPIRADATDRYLYGVSPATGPSVYAYLYVGYEGGGAY